MFTTSSLSSVRLSASGLIALADLRTIAHRTALLGSSSYLDIFFLAPGIHCQQAAAEISRGEYPTAAAMNSGYVFRIENQATISYLQSVGETGHLTNVFVTAPCCRTYADRYELLAFVLYCGGLALTAIVGALLCAIRDWWALGVVGMLVLARFLNVLIIKRRSTIGWKGAPEPGVESDLLILISQDRWVRMRGMVDDVKAVTAGQWLREPTTWEGFGVAFATLLVYCSAVVAGNASTIGSLLIACLLLFSVALLGLCNSLTKTLRMFGRTIYKCGERKFYERRRLMVEELVDKAKPSDWATSIGLIAPTDLQRVVV
jgi:hypothetical protein